MPLPNTRQTFRPGALRSPVLSPGPSLADTKNGNLEPKSEYLRHALDAKRAQHAPSTPITTEAKPLPPVPLVRSSSDPWLDHAKSADDAPQVTPIRRNRKPSDGLTPRHRTQREMQAETEQLKQAMFDMSMKLELIKKQNSELKDQMDEANQRLAELEPLDQENWELREENERLALKLDDVTEEVIQLSDQNKEILKIQEESVVNMEKQNAALEEAAEIILQQETEKTALVQQNLGLKEQILTLQSAPTTQLYDAEIDLSPKHRCPTRVHSIDESRPSTSHFDSDYYSQPASPRVKPSKESMRYGDLSNQAQNILDMNKESMRSTQDLKTRFSNASMRPMIRKTSILDTPQIVGAQQNENAQQPLLRTPRRFKPKASVSPGPSSRKDFAGRVEAVFGTPLSRDEGLRAKYHKGLSLDTSSQARGPPPMYANGLPDPKNSSPTRNSKRPAAPVRQSSRHAQNATYREHSAHSSEAEPNGEPAEESEWEQFKPPPSVVSELTHELDTPVLSPRQDHWWKTIERLTHDKPGRAADSAPFSGNDGARVLPEVNTLFNPTEDEEQFIEKMQRYVKRER